MLMEKKIDTLLAPSPLTPFISIKYFNVNKT